MILLIVKENYQLSLLRVDFGWINNNIKFSLKLVQIEITSTLPSVGWMWISIWTRFNSNLILLFIHPYPPSKGWVNSYIQSIILTSVQEDAWALILSPNTASITISLRLILWLNVCWNGENKSKLLPLKRSYHQNFCLLDARINQPINDLWWILQENAASIVSMCLV